MAYEWDKVIPPEDGKIHMNKNGAVLMSIDTYLDIVIAHKEVAIPKKWIDRWMNKSIADLPATEIVRCEDCIYNTLNTDGVAENWCYKHGIDIEVDDFCSYGERVEVIRNDEMAIEALNGRPKGECRTCKRCSDHCCETDEDFTRCPIEEHYALPKDGYCHLYQQI